MQFQISKTVVTPGQTIQGTKIIEAELATEIVVSLTASQSNKEIDVTFPCADILGLVMTCDKAATVKVNSTSDPAATIALEAGVLVVFGDSFGEVSVTDMFVADVTKLYVTNSANEVATFKLSILRDPTP